jgi:hypothetical protein
MIFTSIFKILSSLLPIIHVSHAAVLSVTEGDASDLKSKFSAACNGDVVLIPPGLYSIDDDLCSGYSSTCTNPSKDIILRGTGSSATKTKLIGVSLQYCDGYIVIDNLSLISGTCESGAIIEDDNGKGILLRNCMVTTPYKDVDTASIDIMSHRIGFINTVIQNPFPYPESQKNGLVEEGDGLVMINSSITGFKTALDLFFPGSHNVTHDYKVFGTTFSGNGVNCHICTDTCSDSCNKLTSLLPNTPAKNTFTVTTFIDILRFDSYRSGSAPGPFIPVQIYFSAVKTAGETTVYRLPSAYPAPPSGLKSATGAVQYYQFDSTAVLSGAATVYFEKSVIDAEFVGSSTKQVYFHNGAAWTVLITSVVNVGGKTFYRFTFPSTVLLSGLIGFFSIPEPKPVPPIPKPLAPVPRPVPKPAAPVRKPGAPLLKPVAPVRKPAPPIRKPAAPLPKPVQ